VAPAANASDVKKWEEWYRLARFTVACSHDEAVQYANLRFVEEQNRAALRNAEAARGQTAPRR
jgi:hypothetical protein